MPHAEVTATETDALDDLFAYDENLDDVFSADHNSDRTNANGSGNRTGATSKDLGIDDEIIIAKKRAPIAKLDETRLLSANGISRLRRTAKGKMRFKGKGHEFSDMQKLLSMYQLWLDDLYPRAKFGDGLMMIEKLGHSKRIQMMRKEWINEGKPKTADDQDDDYASAGDKSGDGLEPKTVDSPSTEEDILDSLIRDAESEKRDQDLVDRQRPRQSRQQPSADTTEQPEEDELDALLAENSRNDANTGDSLFGNGRPAIRTESAEREADMFANEMAAMQEMDEMW